MAKRKKYVVEVGDDLFWFSCQEKMSLADIEIVFKRRIQTMHSEVFPGLKIRDVKGQLLEPKLQIVLVPAEE